MILQLKNPNATQFGPGGWPYKDPRTGFICKPHEGTPAMHAVKIIAHRRANPQHYPPGEGQWFDQQSVIQEIYAQKAATHPHLFQGYPDAQVTVRDKAMVAVVTDKDCPHCGSKESEVRYCKSCSGRRITGRTCKGCGKEFK